MRSLNAAIEFKHFKKCPSKFYWTKIILAFSDSAQCDLREAHFS